MTTWKWMPGMRYICYSCSPDCRVNRVSEYQIENKYAFDDCVPDWEDPATKGCLLEQVRWRHAAEYSTEYRTGKGWRVVYPVGDGTKVMITGWKRTEAIALLAALEEAK